MLTPYVSGLRLPLLTRVSAVAAKGLSMQALVKLAATLRLSLASGSLDGLAFSFAAADPRAVRMSKDASPDRVT